MSKAIPPRTVTRKLIDGRLAGDGAEQDEIALRVDQVLIHDASGPMVAMELEAMGLERVRVERAVGYVDHLLLQESYRSADDHIFFRSACQRFGLWYSRAGNGICHPLHQAYFGRPGDVLVGADSHVAGIGAISMLSIGAGGMDVALVLAGEPYRIPKPAVWGIELHGKLPDWVSAKDVILEMLRRHGLSGGKGRIIEYYGPGLAGLSVMDRHVIASMGAELGATTTVFPSDEVTRDYLARHGRADEWREIVADPGAAYDVEDEVDLSRLEPLVALPSSPANVVPVSEVAGRPVYQCYVGSSANPGFRDFAVVSRTVAGRQVAAGTSLDINPSSATILRDIAASGDLERLISAGARLHQAGCNGCIGLGQVPAIGKVSLRTVPRNFPGRSGVDGDQVYLCSPETIAASALTGEITDPRSMGLAYPRIAEPEMPTLAWEMFRPPLEPGAAAQVPLARSPSMSKLPAMPPLPDTMEIPVLLKAGDNVSTDEILPAGNSMTRWTDLAYMRSLSFGRVDPSYVERANAEPEGHAVVGGSNYGQGSSREHAALAPRWLGLRVVIARDIARIHFTNLVNAGILPITFDDPRDYDRISQGDRLRLTGLHKALGEGRGIEMLNVSTGCKVAARQDLSERMREQIMSGGAIEWIRERLLGRRLDT